MVGGGRFLLHRRLGEGGFGVVYEAEDLRDGGRVALKMLRHAEADWLYRFKREFRAIQGLAHPSLVVLDELFCDDGRWFFTMELIDGCNLVEHVREMPATLPVGAFSEPTTTSGSTVTVLAEPAACSPVISFNEQLLRESLGSLFEGLAVLHAADRVHRDIKPANVLVTRAGRVVLIDFGLVTDSFSGTISAAVGTPAYMAPEQAASQGVGPAADLYAVGVMLFQILTGRFPVEGRPLQILIDKQTREPPSPGSIVSGIPADLDALCVKLLRIDPTRRPSAAEACRSLRPGLDRGVVPERGSTDGSIFVGRAPELASLQEDFELSTKGHLVMVLVSGESGVGKSHLVRRFTKSLLADCPEAMLLEGRCHEREALPYKTLDGIVDALSRRFSRMPVSEVAALLPTHRAMLGRLFPVMLRIPQLAREFAKSDGGVEPQNARQRAFLELRELFARIALDRPTVIVVDDLQWADEDGLKALAEILRPPEAPPLLFIGTVRASPGNGGAVVGRLQAAIPGNLRVIEVMNLGAEDALELASKLLRRAGASGADSEKIASDAGGHPLFVEELVRQAALGGAAGSEVRLDDAIWSRVAQLAGPTREMAELVAVAGKPLPQQVAAAAARLEPSVFQRHAAILRASNLTRTGGARWEDAIEPYHDRVREAVLARLDPSRRATLHEALAIAFESSAHADTETLAVHWRGAGDAPRAAGYAATAGDEALRTFAFDRAALWFTQALELLPRDCETRRGLHVKLGEALALAGRGGDAAPHFEAAAADSPPIEALELQRRAADQLLRCGHFNRGMAASRIVLAAIGMRIPATRLRAFLSFAYYSVRLRLRGLGFRERAKGQVTPDEQTRMDACWSVGLSLSFVDTFVGLILIRRALLLALEVGDLERIVRSLAMVAGGSATTGSSWRRTEQLVRHTFDLAERSGTTETRLFATIARGSSLFLKGCYREAAVHLTDVLQILQDRLTGLVSERVTVRMFLIWSLGYLGRYADLRTYHAEGLRDAQVRGDVYAEVNLKIGSSIMAWLVADQPGLAERETGAAMQQWPLEGFHLEHHFAIYGRICARLYVGDVETAHTLADELARRTKSSLLWRLRHVRVRTLYLQGAAALAMLERRQGDSATHLKEAARAARGVEKEGLAWMQPFARVLRAGVALRKGARDRAVMELDSAARQFAVHDLNAYAASARDRAARLRADHTSAAEIARTAESLQAEGVVAPDRLIAMLLPGLSQESILS
jgi:hypothetical protein